MSEEQLVGLTMETLEFVRKARTSSASDSELSIWSARLAELIAEQAVYAFRMVDSMPDDLRAGYWSVLEEALSALPEYRRIALPPDMLRRLRESAPASIAERVDKTVFCRQGGTHGE